MQKFGLGVGRTRTMIPKAAKNQFCFMDVIERDFLVLSVMVYVKFGLRLWSFTMLHKILICNRRVFTIFNMLHHRTN